MKTNSLLVICYVLEIIIHSGFGADERALAPKIPLEVAVNVMTLDGAETKIVQAFHCKVC